jgi:hypothetical protein
LEIKSIQIMDKSSRERDKWGESMRCSQTRLMHQKIN